MLPFGLECAESVASVAQAAATVPPDYTSGGTVVVSTGSGVTLAGLVRGLRGRPSKFVGVSSGRTADSIQRCLSRYGIEKSRVIGLVPAREEYSVPIDYECPFPSHPHYDRKAWRYLAENAKSLKAPLFWECWSIRQDHPGLSTFGVINGPPSRNHKSIGR
jgi:1-aminocyclopropane-1-carboxylate deaminase/D-cysteine desulfhydrase-like pyridoxal-dependent ACC family enzyme